MKYTELAVRWLDENPYTRSLLKSREWLLEFAELLDKQNKAEGCEYPTPESCLSNHGFFPNCGKNFTKPQDKPKEECGHEGKYKCAKCGLCAYCTEKCPYSKPTLEPIKKLPMVPIGTSGYFDLKESKINELIERLNLLTERVK